MPQGFFRRHNAICNASHTSFTVIRSDIAQPTCIREYRSSSHCCPLQSSLLSYWSKLSDITGFSFACSCRLLMLVA